MTEKQNEYIKALAAELENENVIITYTPSFFGGFETIRMSVSKKGNDRMVIVNGLVPSGTGNWDISIKTVKQQINRDYGEKIV